MKSLQENYLFASDLICNSPNTIVLGDGDGTDWRHEVRQQG